MCTYYTTANYIHVELLTTSLLIVICRYIKCVYWMMDRFIDGLLYTRMEYMIFEYYEIFLNMLREDEQEHAVLLSNYFFFGKLSWVRKVLGKSVLECTLAQLCVNNSDIYVIYRNITRKR